MTWWPMEYTAWKKAAPKSQEEKNQTTPPKRYYPFLIHMSTKTIQTGISRLTKVSQSSGGSPGWGVTILNTSHLEKLLGYRGGNNTSTTGGGDEPHPNGAALSSHFAGDSVGLANLATPEATHHRHNGKLCQDDGTADGSGHLLWALDSKANMSVEVSNGNESLKTCTLTSTGLLLHRHDLKNFVLQSRTNEEVNNLVLLKVQTRKQSLIRSNIPQIYVTNIYPSGHKLTSV